MFADFLAFLVVLQLMWPQVSTLWVLAFMEHLHGHGMSPSNINNYMTAIRSMCIIYDQDTAFMRDQRIPLFIKGLTINRPLQPFLPMVLDEHILMDMLQIIKQLDFPVIYQALYVLCFFSFLRLSNILPHSLGTFDVTRQLCRGDLIFSNGSIVILIKWSKTIQERRSVATITIPALGSSPLCPVRALTAMCRLFPAGDNDPLFVYPKRGSFLPLTDVMVRKHLKKVSQLLKFHKNFTFHDFRRGGATWAFRHGVSMQDIQAQGTWSSDAVWRYIQLPPSASSAVSTAFSSHLYV